MSDINSWLGANDTYISWMESLPSHRAVLAWNRIIAKSSSIRFKTSTGTLAAQTVRLESDNRSAPALSAAGVAPRRRVVIFGVRDHPTIPDTNMDEGYSFFYEGDTYIIRDVILTLGEIQGISEAVR